MSSAKNNLGSHALSVREAMPGVFCIKLGRKGGLSVNAWVVRRAAELVVVDTGFSYTSGALLRALEEVGGSGARVAGVLYTHTHEDHMGGGVEAHSELDCVHYMREQTPSLNRNYWDWYEPWRDWSAWMGEVLTESQASSAFRHAFERRRPDPFRGEASGLLTRAEGVEPGAWIELAGLRWLCVDCPGHGPWHVGWWCEELDLLFAGDVLLRVPTPIVRAHEDELPVYKRTLERWFALSRSLFSSTTLCPGHGRESSDLEAAVRRSAGFVEERERRLRDALAKGPLDLPSMALETYGGRGGRARAEAFVGLASLDSHLHQWQRAALVERLPTGEWVAENVHKLPLWTLV